uniref:Sulfatase N-terminal domain-containing protein n=1 Tax=Panagrolaimus davidi TaxID=227884 RepID=A0A914P977_9BILA
MKNCKPKVPKITKLENGQIFIFPQPNTNILCQWRCLFPKSDDSINWGIWTTAENGTSKPECDIIEIQCRKKEESGTFKNFYKYLHHQIYREDPPSAEMPSPQNLEKADVFVIVIDSVSESQLIRSMPKTVHMLREYYESIPFRHLNKIGINSRPNGFAMLLGKTINSIPKSPMSRGHEADYKNYHAYCSKYLDGEQFIGFRYQDDGYVTMMSEDWAKGLFNWQNCIGFKAKLTDHYMRPFQLQYEASSGIRDKDMDSIMNKGSCKESFNHQIEYLQNFINAYPDKPKFSLTWMINLAHNDYNALYHTDDYFYQFFKNNQEKLNNSYVFFLGDHGPRFGGLRKTDIGETEDNNPFFFLSLPANLRRNTELTEILKSNSKMLISQYDIYATLTEIAKPSNPRTPKPLIKGSSIFHPLPQPRTCDKLMIPFQYCICKPETKILPKNNSIAIPAAEKLVSQMNSNLREYKETRRKCATLKLDINSTIKVEEFVDKGNLKIYHITYSTQPGGGQFWGYVSKRENDETINILSRERHPKKKFMIQHYSLAHFYTFEYSASNG